MSEDEPPEDADIITAEELEKQFQERREQNLDQIEFEKCRQAREAGQVFESSAGVAPVDAVDQVASELEVDEGTTRELLAIYSVVYVEGAGREVGSRSAEIGREYFIGSSIEELTQEYERTQEEIQGDIRAFVGSRLRETDLEDVDLSQELPEVPPDPMVEAMKEIDFEPQLQKVAALLNPKTNPEIQSALSLLTSDLKAANMVAAQTVAPFKAMQEQYQEQLAGLNALFKTNLEPFLELKQQYDEIRESDFEFKWLRDVRHDRFMDLYEVYKEQGNEAAGKVLAAQLRDEEDIEDFKEYFASFDEYSDRQPIVDEALDAHVEGRYALSIPALLSQLDGIFIDTALELGLYTEDDDPTGVQVVNKGEGSPQHIPEIQDEYRRYYASQLWGRRVEILHGKDTDFSDNELLSAKLIWFFFQTLHTVENIRSAEDIGDYHITRVIHQESGCSLETVADELPYQEEYVESRVEVLLRIEVVEQASEEQYTVTEKGVEYLDGELSLEYEEV